MRTEFKHRQFLMELSEPEFWRKIKLSISVKFVSFAFGSFLYFGELDDDGSARRD